MNNIENWVVSSYGYDSLSEFLAIPIFDLIYSAD